MKAGAGPGRVRSAAFRARRTSISTGWRAFRRKGCENCSAVKPEEWAKELKGQKEFFKTLEPYLPNELLEELQKLGQRLSR